MTTPPQKKIPAIFQRIGNVDAFTCRPSKYLEEPAASYFSGRRKIAGGVASIRPSIHLCEASALLFLINIFQLFADRRARARSSPADGGVCRNRRKWPTSKLLKLIKANKSLEMRAGRYVCGWQSSAQVLINRLEIDEWGP